MTQKVTSKSTMDDCKQKSKDKKKLTINERLNRKIEQDKKEMSILNEQT